MRIEIEAALERNVPVIPVLVDGARSCHRPTTCLRLSRS
jgi:hypothetical protein